MFSQQSKGTDSLALAVTALSFTLPMSCTQHEDVPATTVQAQPISSSSDRILDAPSREQQLREIFNPGSLAPSIVNAIHTLIQEDASNEFDFELTGVVHRTPSGMSIETIHPELEQSYLESIQRFVDGDNSKLQAMIELTAAYVGNSPKPEKNEYLDTLSIAHQILDDLNQTRQYLAEHPDGLEPIQRRGLADVVRFNIISNMNLGRTEVHNHLADPECIAVFHVHTNSAPPSPVDMRAKHESDLPSIVFSYSDDSNPVTDVYLIRSAGYEKICTVPAQ